MTSDTKIALSDEKPPKKLLKVSEEKLDIDLNQALHLSSSTAQLCPQWTPECERKVANMYGTDNYGFELTDSNNNPDNYESQTTPDSSDSSSPEAKQKWYKSLKGLSLTIVSGLFFSSTTVIVKSVKEVDPGQMAFFRFLGILLFTIPIVSDQKKNPFGPKSSRHWLVLRGLAGASSLYFRYSALQYMSIANATVIVLSMPVFVFIFARIFLKEPFGIFHILALLVSLIGITMTSKLAVIFTSSSDAIKEIGIDSKKEMMGLAFSLGATLIGSAAYVLVRKLKGIHHSIILFNFSLVAITETSLITLCLYEFNVTPKPLTGLNSHAWALCLVGVLSFYGQLLLTKALQQEEAGLVSITRASSEVLYSFIFQIFIFDEMPDKYSISGAILVMFSVLMTSARKWILTLPENSSIRHNLNFLTK